MGVWGFSEDRGDHLLILFGFQRAGGVDGAAAGTDGAEGGEEDGALAFGLPRQIFDSKAVADFRIASQRAGAAARDVGQCKVEGGVFIQRGGVDEATFDSVAKRGEALAQRLESLRAGLAGDDAGFEIALSEDKRFVAGGGAGIQNRFGRGGASGAGQFGNQLGAFILKAQPALAEGCAAEEVSRPIAGDYGLGNGEQLAGLEMNAVRGKFFGDRRVVDAEGEDGLGLAVAANGAGGVEAVEVGPACDHPGRVGLGEG